MRKFLIALLAIFALTGSAFAAVDLNTADQKTLESVKGIGPVKAKAIIDYRTKNGPFKSAEDLDKVKGFGAKSINKMESELTIDGKPLAPVAETKESKKGEAAPKAAAAPAPAAPAPAAPAPAAAAPKAAAPAAAAGASAAPAVADKKAEAPKADAKKADTKKAEAPKAEDKKADAPKSDDGKDKKKSKKEKKNKKEKDAAPSDKDAGKDAKK